MEYVFTRHAKERMRIRKITKRDVLDTIEKKQLKALDNERENKIAFYRRWTEKLVLKVVTIEIENKIRIITVYPISSKRLRNIKSLIEIK